MPVRYLGSIPENPNKLYNPAGAATFIGVTKETLAIWRSTRRYPLPYIKVGRLVRYRESDLIAFLEIGRAHV